MADKVALERIRALAIPPAWEDVWICPHPNGHIQAVGADARGRKQYRITTTGASGATREKFEHMIEFGRALPSVRELTARHVSLLPDNALLFDYKAKGGKRRLQ